MILKYQNIAISGSVASGKNTLLEGLKPYLEPGGWNFASAGQLIRERSGDNVSPRASQVSDDFHTFVERRTESLFRDHAHYVIEAHLAGWVARNREDTLRVLLICSDHQVVIDRVSKRDHVSTSEAERIVGVRMSEDDATWKRIYGDHAFMDPAHFHLVIDTSATGKKEAVRMVLDALGYPVDSRQ